MSRDEHEEDRFRERRRIARVAFAVVGLIMLGHAALETARDALYLERDHPARLPLAYLAIAVTAVVVGRLSVAVTDRVGARRALPATLYVGAAITLVFTARPEGTAALGTLYVWVGVFASAVVVQLWSRLGRLLDVAEAKLTFGFIGAGALIGASAGAGLSMVVLELGGSPVHLVALGSGSFAVAGTVALGLGGQPSADPPLITDSTVAATTDERRFMIRLALGLAAAAAAFTWVDLGFKTAAVEAVAPGELGIFFARVYTGLNVTSVLIQLLVLPRLLRFAGASRAVKVLPFIAFVGGLALALTGHLAVAAGLLIAQGTLRHGLFKTSYEILAMPLRPRVRARFKALGETAAQRGGQALAATAGLIVFELGGGPAGVGVLVAIVAGAWLWGMRDIAADYLGLVRFRLGTGARAFEIPDLDLAALETLVEALSSEDEREVLGALDWFETYGRSHLVPALILFHPSSAVTLRALALFDAHPRSDAVSVAHRRLDDPDPAVRASALRLIAHQGRGLDQARRLAGVDHSPLVRAEALAILVQQGDITRSEACQQLSSLVDSSDEAGAIATARALDRFPASEFGGLAQILAEHPSPEVATALAAALGRKPHPTHAVALVRLLGTRAARPEARAALIALGPAGESALEQGLDNAEQSVQVRRQIPRVLGDFVVDDASADRIAGILMRCIEHEGEGRVATPALRALARVMSRFPDTNVDAGVVQTSVQTELRRALTLLKASRALRHHEQGRRPARELLVRLLRERSDRALRDTFTWLHIQRPKAGLLEAFEALTQDSRSRRASALELLEVVEPVRTRRALEALTGEGTEADRIARASAFVDSNHLEAASEALWSASSEVREAELELLEALLESKSRALRALAQQDARELAGELEPPTKVFDGP